MTEEFIELIKSHKILYNLKNCNCCFGTLARGKIFKEKFPDEIFFSAKHGLNIKKKGFFPYRLFTRDFEKVIRGNDISLIIHDLKVNFELYNLGIKLKIPQYFIYVNQGFRWQCNLFKKIILPYPEEMGKEFKYIKRSKIFAGFIIRELEKEKIPEIKKRYEIGEKPIISVSVSTGKSFYSQQLFEYAYETFRKDYDLIFIYGLFYKGRKFPVKSAIFEENLIELFFLSEKIICFGAYNTVAEALSLGKEILSFPKPNNDGEQEVKKIAKYFKNITILKI